MKRSAQVRLLLMGSAAIALAGCNDESKSEEARVYESVEQCVKDGVYTEKYCRDSFEAAQKVHPQAAPHYASKSECEADFGAARCQQPAASGTSGGESSPWIPAMAGFLVGQVVSNLTHSLSQPLYRPDVGRRDWGGISSPRSYDPGSWRTGGNVEVGRTTGTTTLRPDVFSRSNTGSVPQSTTTVSRGGFGARASSVGVSS